MTYAPLEFAEMPRARSSDPSTSQRAARRARDFATSHAGRILAAIKHAPRNTPEYYAQMTGLTVVQIDRRLVEMQRQSLIQVVQHNGQDMTYRGFRVWEAI